MIGQTTRGAPAGEKALCPCCGNPSAFAPIETIPYRRIWASLREEWGAVFSDEVVRRHSPCDDTALFECLSCGGQFFDPPAAGDPDFYRELAGSPRYYAPWKWEFDWVRERLPRRAAVLDVGCGSGDFLAGVAADGGRAVGLDPSAAAVAQARARGVDAREGGLQAHAAEFAGAFDAVCAFHVVEHLPDPGPFVLSLRQCLRPGGSVFLSVPNRMRSGRAPLEGLDCPPHHLTRWSPASLAVLVRRSGLTLHEMATEPVELSVPRDRLREAIRNRVEPVPLLGRHLGVWLPRVAWRLVFLPPLLSLYRRYRLLERAGFFGLSVAARCAEGPP